MSICVECLKLRKRLDELGERYDDLLKEHSKLLRTSTNILENQKTVERDQQIALTSNALKSFERSAITLSPPLKDEKDG